MNDRRLDITELLNVPATGEELHLDRVIDEETSTVLSGDRDPLDRVAEEFVERCRRGESPSIAEYQARFPDQAAKVRKLLGAVATMEQLRRGSRQARSMPEWIGEFRVLRELGRGGMGVVYEAVQESLWRHVAVKTIHHSQLDAKRLQRFQREAQAVAQLHHTNIVPIFGVGEHDGIPYYAMQYIKGRGLDAVLAGWREGNAPQGADHWRIAARYTKQAAEALGYAHEQGVFHRDIKPANLLIDEQDAVWITDFGLAKMVGHEELTASGDVIGTLRYLAPESLRGISEGRSDVYSLGLTLYEMLTLSPPYGDLSPSELLHKVSDGQPVRPRNLDPAIPRDLETIVLKATARDLKDRYATAKALASDLDSFLHDRPIHARRINLFERTWRWSRRNRGIAAFAALAVASLVVAAISGWVGYVRSDLAFQRQNLNSKETEHNLRVLNQIIMEWSETLFPEDLIKDETAADALISLNQTRLAVSEDPDRPLTFADRSDTSGPPKGRFGDHADGPGPGPPGDHRPKGDRDDFPGDDFAGGPPPPFDDAMRGGPPRHGGESDQSSWNDKTRTITLLKNFLDKYQDFVFSPENETSLERQSQVAWLYYKLGKYNEQLLKLEEADQAYTRSLMMFDMLSTEKGVKPGMFRRFFQFSSGINPWQADPAMRQSVEERLERIQRTLGRLLAMTPGSLDYLRAQMQLLAKLGLIRYQQGRPDPEACFRQALTVADQLVKRDPEAGYPHSDRADVLQAYAIVLEDQGQKAEARTYLDAAFDELEWVAADGLKSITLAGRMESLADDFEKLLGDAQRSDQIQRRADQIDPRPPFSDRPKPGRPFAPRHAETGPPLADAPAG